MYRFVFRYTFCFAAKGESTVTKIEELRKKAMALPESPGVYIMKNKSGEIIYIGKAKVLKNRVSQYFGSQNNHTTKVRRMVENVHDFDYIIVGSEFEALVLECNLIKQNKPKYNILLKDAKGYHYLKITDNEGWKMVYSVKQKYDDGAEYIGPYMSSEYVNTALQQALDIFALPHCEKQFPCDISRKARPCLNYHIKLCSGVCCGSISKTEHNANVEDALDFITGNKNDFLRSLHIKMDKASEELEFEKAAKYRDRIRSIEKIAAKQHVVSLKYKNQDVFGFASINQKTCLSVICFRAGSITDTQTFIFDRIENPDEEYADILGEYYAGKDDFPDRICIATQLSSAGFLENSFSELAGKKVLIYVPLAGEGKTLLEMAEKNAEEKLARVLSSNDRRSAPVHELQELLGLDKLPYYIEAYDISNTNGQENVAGMVVFADGRPYKKAYRRFQIKSFEGQDDYRSLAEVLTRRITEYKNADNHDEGFGRKPDLILLDGGIGQVNAVKLIFERYGFDVPLFGMVKDSKHRTRAIASDGGEIMINDNRGVFSFIAGIQEEVHRYAITYHHNLKKKNTLASALSEIKGIGDKRAQALMTRFRTLDALKKADIDEIMSVPGMTKDAAENVYDYFNG